MNRKLSWMLRPNTAKKFTSFVHLKALRQSCFYVRSYQVGGILSSWKKLISFNFSLTLWTNISLKFSMIYRPYKSVCVTWNSFMEISWRTCLMECQVKASCVDWFWSGWKRKWGRISSFYEQRSNMARWCRDGRPFRVEHDNYWF